jgi:hypothetical protein
MILIWVYYPKANATSTLYPTNPVEAFTNMIEGLDNSSSTSSSDATTPVTINTKISSRYKYGTSVLKEDVINNYTLKDYYIMSSFNSFIQSSDLTYGVVDLIMADYLLAQGVRYFDICVFPDAINPSIPVIANSTDKTNREIKNTQNTILLQDAIKVLSTKAFNRKYSPNPNDPLIIMIRTSPCEESSQEYITNIANILDTGILEKYKPSIYYRYNMQNEHILQNDINSEDNRVLQSNMCKLITDTANINNNLEEIKNISEQLIVTNFAFIPLYAVQQKMLIVMDDSCPALLANSTIQSNICSVFTNYALEDGVLSSSTFLQTEKVNLSLDNIKNVILSAPEVSDSVSDNNESTKTPFINYGMMNMMCAYPPLFQSNPPSTDFLKMSALGFQIVPQRWYISNPSTDTNLKDAIEYFNSAGCSFVVRSDKNNVKTVCKELTKQKYSSQPKQFTSTYPPSSFDIYMNQSSADSNPNFIT